MSGSRSASRRLQRGIGMLGLIFAIGLGGFFLTLVFKLGPSYASFLTLRSLMNDLAASEEGVPGGPKAILQQLQNRVDINDLRSLPANALSIRAEGGKRFKVKAAYEDRQHLFFNVDAVLTFEHEVAVQGQ